MWNMVTVRTKKGNVNLMPKHPLLVAGERLAGEVDVRYQSGGGGTAEMAAREIANLLGAAYEAVRSEYRELGAWERAFGYPVPEPVDFANELAVHLRAAVLDRAGLSATEAGRLLGALARHLGAKAAELLGLPGDA